MTITDAERRRLEALDAALIGLRRGVAAAIGSGLDGERVGIERKIGDVQAILTVMAEHGDVSQAACIEHAKRVYGAMSVPVKGRAH